MTALTLPANLKSAITLGNCVAFVGAGFSAPIGMPNWRQLLEALWTAGSAQQSDSNLEDTLRVSKKSIDAGDFIVAASELRKALHSSDINRVISDLFRESNILRAPDEKRIIMTRRIDSLVNGPWAGIITTNYDTLIERGLDNVQQRKIVKALNSNADLGMCLNRTSPEELFFAKLHGSIDTANTILTQQEYDNVYLKSSRIQNFLRASMLVYNYVFIGSSLEGHLLAIRQALCSDYDGGIPIAFALLSASETNVRRARWLTDTARIHCILYPEGEHIALDSLLQQMHKLKEGQIKQKFPSIGLVSEIRDAADTESKIKAIGSVNASIVKYIEMKGEPLQKTEVIGLISANTIPSFLKKLSKDELFYRIAFLVSIGLVEERQVNQETVYVMPSGEK